MKAIVVAMTAAQAESWARTNELNKHEYELNKHEYVFVNRYTQVLGLDPKTTAVVYVEDLAGWNKLTHDIQLYIRRLISEVHLNSVVVLML